MRRDWNRHGSAEAEFCRASKNRFIFAVVGTLCPHYTNRRSPEQEPAAIEVQVCQFITYEYSQGRKYSGKDLEDSAKKMNLTRAQIRAAITALKVSGRIIYVEVRGKSGSHFAPVTLADTAGDTMENELCDMHY